MFTTFTAGDAGSRQILRITPVTGDSLAPASHLAVAPVATLPAASAAGWPLTGVASHVRYVERTEKTALVAVQAGLGRPDATLAALIPIRKSTAWWELTQEERRRIFEDKSQHIAASMKYLPAIARQLYHARDLGQPFDFLTWFEFAPEHAQVFEDLVGMLRATEEWRFVEREVDVRLRRAD
ncbi:chlorite dismutase family protein [Rhodopseudomonas sp. RCAM05734]|uniref:chlorite dismutase family protein n=1 Tax=Rhodopseudomonas sp. RCAM05734 TaxID=3457549 RepID=UPI004043C100